MSAPTQTPTLPEQNTEHPHVLLVNGIPTVRGSRIPVRILAQLYRAGDSVDDLAVAIVDELETPRHVRRRFTLAY